MRPNSKMLFCTIGLMVTLSLLIGCGSSGDLLDEETTRYNAFALPFDGVDDSTNEIDVVRTDCNDDPLITELGLLFPFDVQVTVTSVIDTVANNPTINQNPDFRVERYTVTLRPDSGTYGTVNNETSIDGGLMPDLTDTALNPRTRSTSSALITPGSTVTLNLPVWSAGDKDAYVTYLNTFPLLTAAGFTGSQTVFSYDVQVVLHCRTVEDDTFDITANWTQVFFGSYLLGDECSG